MFLENSEEELQINSLIKIFRPIVANFVDSIAEVVDGFTIWSLRFRELKRYHHAVPMDRGNISSRSSPRGPRERGRVGISVSVRLLNRCRATLLSERSVRTISTDPRVSRGKSLLNGHRIHFNALLAVFCEPLFASTIPVRD